MTERRGPGCFKISAWVPSGAVVGWPGLRTAAMPPLPGQGQSRLCGSRFLLVVSLSLSPQPGLFLLF